MKKTTFLTGLFFTTLFSPIRHAYADIVSGSPVTYKSDTPDPSSGSSVTIDTGGVLTLENFGEGNTTITNNGTLNVSVDPTTNSGVSTISTLSPNSSSSSVVSLDKGTTLSLTNANGTYNGTISGQGGLSIAGGVFQLGGAE